MSDVDVRSAVQSIFSRPPFLQWYTGALAARGKVSARLVDAEAAADDFLTRARVDDISPVRFFDPTWFRTNYPVAGVNGFLSYLRNPGQRLASPSAVFAPRWYCRQNRLNSSVHPLLHYLLADDERDPHPLLDMHFLAAQNACWQSGMVALEYLIDPEKHGLNPHPLFDGKRYLDRNPDVAEARQSPLEHYLSHGHLEGRAPNRFFAPAWYRNEYLDPGRPNGVRREPLTDYVTGGCARGNLPAPGLQALAKSSTKLTRHGPQIYIDCLEEDRNLYAAMRHRPVIEAGDFRTYLSGHIKDYDPSFPDYMVMLPRHRLAVMFTPKCASATIVSWWLDHANLFAVATRFSFWPHAFDIVFRSSREYLGDALSFDPRRYSVYKFVRNPLLRVASGFTHVLMFPQDFGLAAGTQSMSFFEFLDRVEADGFGNNRHFAPQRTAEEESGRISPRILKIEDGLDSQLRALESAHGLPRASFDTRRETVRTLWDHAWQNRPTASAGPDVRIPLHRIPNYRALLTPEAVKRIYTLYAGDFELYGYSPQPPWAERATLTHTGP